MPVKLKPLPQRRSVSRRLPTQHIMLNFKFKKKVYQKKNKESNLFFGREEKSSSFGRRRGMGTAKGALTQNQKKQKIVG